MDNLIGKMLGQYQIIEEIGRGGMAIVYKAYQPSLTRHVAIKVLPQQFSFDQEFVERFVREARGAAVLHHPNIITIHDVSEQDGIHYFVMEYLAGKTLDAVLGDKPMPLQRISRIMDQVADALDHAHSQGLIHRDIKPSNIIVDENRNDHVVLMDFGLVRAGQDSKLTKTGMIVGTPEYMSPEQAQGEEVDYRTDIYSLGVVLFRMLTGTAPFVRSTPAAVLLAHVAYDPPLTSQISPTVPKSVEAVVLKAMSKDCGLRYQSAGQLARDLRVAITGQMPAGLKAASPARGTKPASAAVRAPAPKTPPPTPKTSPSVASTVLVSAPAAPVAPRKAGRVSPLAIAGLLLALLAVFAVVGGVLIYALVLKPNTAPSASPSPSGALLAAPSLKGPANGATFSPKEAVTLTWEAAPGLESNDSYVVFLECASGPSLPPEWGKETSYTLPPSLYSSLGTPFQCNWYVTVMRQTGTDANGARTGVVRSAPSSTWQFSWRQATATLVQQPTAPLSTTVTPAPTLTLTPTRRPPTNTPPRPTNTPLPTPTEKPEKEGEVH
jgi:serine/threonine protein kinase